jgi:hypothetical protein
MNKMNFKTSVEIDYCYYNSKILMLNKNKDLVEIEYDFDIGLEQKELEVSWSLDTYCIRDNHVNLEIKVPDQKIKTYLEIDLDSLDPNKNLLIEGEGYNSFELEFDLINVKNNFTDIGANPFVDDFAPSEMEFKVREIRQVSDDKFVMIVGDVELKF